MGPQADAARIPGIDTALGDGESWQFGDLEMRVFDTPGHTRGHITLHFPEAGALFPGALSMSERLQGPPRWGGGTTLRPAPLAATPGCIRTQLPLRA